MRLFVRPENFQAYEEEVGNREWYLWHSQNGWMHRSHIMTRPEALTRTANITTPEPTVKSARQRIAELGIKSQIKQITH
jgi:hypothetical protein